MDLSSIMGRLSTFGRRSSSGEANNISTISSSTAATSVAAAGRYDDDDHDDVDSLMKEAEENYRMLNYSTVSVARTSSAPPQQQHQTSAKDEDEEDKPLYEFKLSIENTPYHISLFLHDERLYADFEDLNTGKVRTKRLSSKWLTPPEHAAQNKLEWYKANIASVLVKSRGPENTPNRPPARKPPQVVLPAAKSEAMAGELRALKLEMAQMRAKQAAQDAALREREEEIAQLKSMALTTIPAVEDNIVLAMARQDVREMQASKLAAERVAFEKTQLCLEVLAEGEKLQQELEDMHKKYHAVANVVQEVCSELKLSEARAALLACQLEESQNKVQELSNYSTELLQGKH